MASRDIIGEGKCFVGRGEYRIRERVKCFQKVCYVVLRGKKNGDGKGKKKMLEKENVTNAGRTTNKHKKEKDQA